MDLQSLSHTERDSKLQIWGTLEGGLEIRALKLPDDAKNDPICFNLTRADVSILLAFIEARRKG